MASPLRALVLLTLLALGTATALPIPHPTVPFNHNDAGTRTDAPNVRTTAWTIAPDVVHRGDIAGSLSDDWIDFYLIRGSEGQVFDLQADSIDLCFWLYRGQDNGSAHMDYECSALGASYRCCGGPEGDEFMTVGFDVGYSVKLPATDDYFLVIGAFEPSPYRFSYSLTGEAPDIDGILGD